MLDAGNDPLPELPVEGIWAILEFMGHRKLAGHVREVSIAGTGMLRLDIYDGTEPMVTQYYRPGVVYCMTPTTEEIARAMGTTLQPTPATAFDDDAALAQLTADLDDDNPF